MRRDLLPLLACPVCRAPLTLAIDREEEGEIVAGMLECTRCHERYPIKDTIPNLLPPERPGAQAGYPPPRRRREKRKHARQERGGQETSLE